MIGAGEQDEELEHFHDELEEIGDFEDEIDEEASAEAEEALDDTEEASPEKVQDPESRDQTAGDVHDQSE